MAAYEDRARSPYHHGDLRKALLEAAEAELAEKGVEGFTLRGCAKRAGVSHAAPAHHFKDANALLTALAAVGFERFVAQQERRQSTAAPDARAQHLAAGLGYIEFARENPALFQLMFASRRTDFADPALSEAGRKAYAKLLLGVRGAIGEERSETEQRSAVVASWAIVHGLANLFLAGRLSELNGLPDEERERMLSAIIARGIS